MINAKSLYYSILQDERLTELVGEDNILDAYPETVETFPCVIFLEENQLDREFADNQPLADELSLTVHIFTKALDGYPTSSEIGLVVATIMRGNFFVATQNREMSDVSDNVRHRVMAFRKVLLS